MEMHCRKRQSRVTILESSGKLAGLFLANLAPPFCTGRFTQVMGQAKQLENVVKHLC
jgi:hypothetical protein